MKKRNYCEAIEFGLPIDHWKIILYQTIRSFTPLRGERQLCRAAWICSSVVQATRYVEVRTAAPNVIVCGSFKPILRTSMNEFVSG